ncbi:uncharacterized protein [Phaseolus vulgaris]|uniref:uncharacterized protein n=1 Tax=Phaseolus vulgaris TaxID=3885 RepID=UPI0035CBC282
MKIFVESFDHGIWDSIENGPFIPKFKKNGSLIAKPWSQWTNEESKMAKLDCTAQNIIASALDTNEFSRISKCKTAKEMWDTLKATHGNSNESKELLQIFFKGRILVNGSVLKVDHVQKGFTTVIKEYIPKSWKIKSLND